MYYESTPQRATNENYAIQPYARHESELKPREPLASTRASNTYAQHLASRRRRPPATHMLSSTASRVRRKRASCFIGVQQKTRQNGVATNKTDLSFTVRTTSMGHKRAAEGPREIDLRSATRLDGFDTGDARLLHPATPTPLAIS